MDEAYLPGSRPRGDNPSFVAEVFLHVHCEHIVGMQRRFDSLHLDEQVTFTVPASLEPNRIDRIPESLEHWQGMFEQTTVSPPVSTARKQL